MSSTIDCVILWVDGGDEKWIKEKNRYAGKTSKADADAEKERFRDWGILKYLFRGIEKNAPWFRYIYFVTCGQIPDWLNVNHPQLKLVNHTDFIPEKYLPTFSSHTIELNLHRIKGLSETFVYFNDDMFILNKTEPEDFFVNGQPCDSAVLNAIALEKTEKEFRFLMPINNIEIINKYFHKKNVLKSNFKKYFTPVYGMDIIRTFCLMPWVHFTGFINYHLPYSIKKKYLAELWEKEPQVMDTTCSHRFRNSNDVNIWLVSYWQYACGDFHPRNPKKFGYKSALTDNRKENENLYQFIRRQKSKVICINDTVSVGNFDKIQKGIDRAFSKVYPCKSKFEK